MDWLLPAQFVALTGSLILVLTYLNLYLEERQKHLAFWLASWSLYVARSVFEILVVFWGSHRAFVALSLLSLIWSAALLLWGTCLFSGKKLNSRWPALFTVGSLWIIAGLSLRLPSLWITVPSYLLSAFASIATGVALLRFTEARGPARFTAGWAFILWGLHKADHPLLRPLAWAAPFGYVLGAVLGFVSAIGVVLVYLEKTKKELKASEEKYRSIFENAALGIFQTTPEGRFLRVNPALARMFGYASPEEAIDDVGDLSTQVYADPDDRRRLIALVRESGFVEKFEVKTLKRDGEPHWISINVRAVRDEKGGIGFYEGSSEDITDRKRAEDEARMSRLQLSDAADLARIAHWEHDEASNEYTFNDAFYALYATTADREGGYRMAREEYLRSREKICFCGDYVSCFLVLGRG